MLPLHCALENDAPLEVVQAVLEANRDAAKTPDKVPFTAIVNACLARSQFQRMAFRTCCWL